MKPLVFKKIHKGLYINHEFKMTLEHEVSWRISEGRKWIAAWNESYMGLMEPTRRTRKFDAMADARAFLNNLVSRERKASR